jgi:hypothetical protein
MQQALTALAGSGAEVAMPARTVAGRVGRKPVRS